MELHYQHRLYARASYIPSSKMVQHVFPNKEINAELEALAGLKWTESAIKELYLNNLSRGWNAVKREMDVAGPYDVYLGKLI